MSDLRPCPFCGSDDLRIDGGFVRCNNCECDGPYHEEMDESDEDSIEGIAEKWNTRAADARADKLAELLREVMSPRLISQDDALSLREKIDAALAAHDAEKQK